MIARENESSGTPWPITPVHWALSCPSSFYDWCRNAGLCVKLRSCGLTAYAHGRFPLEMWVTGHGWQRRWIFYFTLDMVYSLPCTYFPLAFFFIDHFFQEPLVSLDFSISTIYNILRRRFQSAISFVKYITHLVLLPTSAWWIEIALRKDSNKKNQLPTHLERYDDDLQNRTNGVKERYGLPLAESTYTSLVMGRGGGWYCPQWSTTKEAAGAHCASLV